MNQKERLVEKIKMSVAPSAGDWAEVIAEELLADGWMRPPVKVGQTLYVVAEVSKQIVECTVIGFYVIENRCTIITNLGVICDDSFGKTVFTSREDAEKSLKGCVHK